MPGTRRIVIMIVTLIGAMAARGEAQEPLGHYPGEGVFRIAIGSFEPRGDSEYWQEKEQDFFADASEFEDVALTADFLWFVSPRAGLLVSVGGWEGDQTQAYREYVDENGRDITHLARHEQAWLDVGLVFHLLARRAVLMPYVGGGGSLVSWELEEDGEFIDFGVNPPEIFRDDFFDSGEDFGYFLLVGVEIPVSRSVSLFAEGRWRHADTELDGDFAGLGTLDLSGRSITAGASISF